MIRTLNTLKDILVDPRTWILLAPAVLVLAIDVPVLLTLLYALSAVFLIVGVAHIIRKILLPYIDLESDIDQAETTPIGAAIVAFGVLIFYAVTVLSVVVWVSR